MEAQLPSELMLKLGLKHFKLAGIRGEILGVEHWATDNSYIQINYLEPKCQLKKKYIVHLSDIYKSKVSEKYGYYKFKLEFFKQNQISYSLKYADNYREMLKKAKENAMKARMGS
jgi:hypothetical protein